MNVLPQDLFARNYNSLSNNSESIDFFKAVKKAAILRQFLIDQDALIHIVNRELKLKIVFEVDDTFVQQFTESASLLYSSKEIGNMVLKHSERLKSLKLAEFLSLNILKIGNELFDVKEIIKYAANKQGGVHFDPRTNSEDEKLKTALNSLIDIPALAIAINTVASIVLVALRPMRNALLTFPDYSNFLAHYKYREKGSVFLEGNQHIETNGMNTSIRGGFGWFGEIKVVHQKFTGRSYIYQIGTVEGKGFRFSIFIDSRGGLHGEACLNDSKILKVKFLNFRGTMAFNSEISLSVVLLIEEAEAKLEMWINDNLVDRAETSFRKIYRKIDRHVVAGDLKGKRNVTLFLKEVLILIDNLTDINVQSVIKYLERKRKD